MIKGNISSSLLFLTNINIILLIGFHIVASRMANKRGGFKSPQMFLIKLVLFMNIPLFIGIILTALIELRTIIDIVLMLLFGALVFNCLSYVYFHFFNMSESARKIRILIELYTNGATSLDNLGIVYNPDIIISERLKRLLEMKEITVDEFGTYHLDGKKLIPVASAFEKLRKMF